MRYSNKPSKSTLTVGSATARGLMYVWVFKERWEPGRSNKKRPCLHLYPRGLRPLQSPILAHVEAGSLHDVPSRAGGRPANCYSTVNSEFPLMVVLAPPRRIIFKPVVVHACTPV